MTCKVIKAQKKLRETASLLALSAACQFQVRLHSSLHSSLHRLLHRHQRVILATAGAVMLFSGTEGVAFAAPPQGYDGQIIFGLCRVMALSQGMFGALVMSVAGLVAIISAATGAYKASMNAVAVGAGAYLVRPMVMLFFGDPVCEDVGVHFLPIGSSPG